MSAASGVPATGAQHSLGSDIRFPIRTLDLTGAAKAWLRRPQEPSDAWHIACTRSGVTSIFAPAADVPVVVHKRVWRRPAVVGTAAVAVIVAAAVALEVRRLTLLNTQVRVELEAWLSHRLASDVTIDRLDVSLLPKARVRARGITIRVPGRPDLPPFVTVASWSGTAQLTYRGIRHFEQVSLSGVRITVPPRRMADLRSSTRPRREGRGRPPSFSIDRLDADRVAVVVLPRDSTREPHAWDVRDLRMTQFSFDEATPFEATVDTPLPTDRATVTGTVGPWPRGDFDQLPLAGSYALNGRLDGVPGMTGAIAVRGRALGTLDRLATSGEVTSPAAGLEGAHGAALPMTAVYEALFDATNSDVRLSHIRLTIGEAAMIASGQVIRAAGASSRALSLRVRNASARGSVDLLRLILDPAPVRGALDFDVAVEMQAADRPVLDRLSISGRFDLRQARFVDDTVQGALDAVSARGLGTPGTVTPKVPIDARGTVRFSGGDLHLQRASLAVPGAEVEGGGTYTLGRDIVAFRGVAKLQARLSQTQRGVKRWLLKPFNPLFARGGAGTRLVLTVSGARATPEVDIDLTASVRGER